MFDFWRHKKDSEAPIAALHEELEKSKQEREAARLGLASAVCRLVNELREFPLDQKVEAVAAELLPERDDHGRS